MPPKKSVPVSDAESDNMEMEVPKKRRKTSGPGILPPVFDPNTMEYETWKKKLLRWNKLSHLPEEEKALCFHLSLTGRAEIASANIPDDD